ncbi:hypothetical protein KGF54_004189 [Candida jiufengensis]|uniref:uncharacterized protein n=1 Tax=Candida jiufengensis TaxID=497108 RepID=UPI0022241C71|nr:uncharacterized protein KGF54_004189 [Candida jiufengensis]KAI5951115.1 hypothetical protein KGF54_004189 [Candida jiufengensis]
MCISIATTSHPDYPLILCSNRDEYFKRPTNPAQFRRLNDSVQILTPLDLARPEHGTWIGVTTTGKIAVLVNYRDLDTEMTLCEVSRGVLPLSYLKSNLSDEEWREQLMSEVENNDNKIDITKIGGFSLLYGHLKLDSQTQKIEHLNILSNRGNYGKIFETVENGNIVESEYDDDGISEKTTFGLSNSLYNEPWKKVKMGEKLLNSLIETSIQKNYNQEKLVEECFKVMKTDTYDKTINEGKSFDTKILELRNSIFIPPIKRNGPESNLLSIGDYYGTRTQTIILLTKTGELNYYERNLHMADKPEVEKPLITSCFKYNIWD